MEENNLKTYAYGQPLRVKKAWKVQKKRSLIPTVTKLFYLIETKLLEAAIEKAELRYRV